MKKKIIIGIISAAAIGIVIASAFIIKNYRDKKEDDDTYIPAPGEYYDPDQLEWT